jgi:hypothetical protein
VSDARARVGARERAREGKRAGCVSARAHRRVDGPRRPSARSGTRSWLKKSTRRRATRRDDDERRDRGRFVAREGDVPPDALATSAIAAPVTPTPHAARRCDASDAKGESFYIRDVGTGHKTDKTRCALGFANFLARLREDAHAKARRELRVTM